ncbi:phage major capsid protein [Kitasatospora sp. NPDC001175]|uniref:phage major capsid protein n=1 Tax=Kitasatospora sp. NPDC001175 TaxID=3157103 RepID=UPI003CFE42E9
MDKREVLADLRTKRREAQKEMRAILSKPKAEKRNLNAAEVAEFNRLETDLWAFDDRIDELDEQLRADNAAAPMQSKYAPRNSTNDRSSVSNTATRMPGYSRFQVSEAEIYRPDGGNSYFRDLFTSQHKGDGDAADRIRRNNARQYEKRAISTTNGAGGEFVPPAWLETQFVKLARPGRVIADRATYMPLPAGTDVINLPKVNTGTAEAVQGTQNSAVQQTDMTTTSVGSPVVTIAGGQTLSLQLVEQSPVAMDQVILSDLAADYAMKLDQQVIGGSGTGGAATGLLTLAGTTSVAWTQATPALGGAGGLYSKIAQAIQSIHTSRYLPPDAILMHPRRWAWITAQSDANGRPLIVPDASGPWNAAGVQAGEVVAEGYVGKILGLPVYVDANLPTNLGAGTNQDPIILARTSDLFLWESHIRAEAFPQTYAQNMSLFCRLYSYISFQAARYPQSIAIISGTGSVTPSF